MKPPRKRTAQDIINELNMQIYRGLKPIRWPFILIQLIFVIGSMGYVIIDDFSIMDAIYQTGITFTTVGFGEISPISNLGRIFTLFLIISGFAVFSVAITTVSVVARSDIFSRLIKEKKMLQNIIQLHDHFVVYYYNEYTAQVIEQFKVNHIPFILVDPDNEIEKIAIDKKYPYYVIAQPHTEDAHLKCNLASAKGVIILSKNTSDNIAQIVSVRLYERELERMPYHISSYGSNDYDIDKLQKLGADQVLSPADLLARKVGITALNPKKARTLAFLEEIFYKKNSLMNVEEYIVQKESWVVLKRIQETYMRDIADVLIIGITHKDKSLIFMPKKNIVIGPFSKLLLMGSNINIEKAKKVLKRTIIPDFVKSKLSQSKR
jgi:voltage-gated potassium channel